MLVLYIEYGLQSVGWHRRTGLRV